MWGLEAKYRTENDHWTRIFSQPSHSERMIISKKISVNFIFTFFSNLMLAFLSGKAL